MGCLEPPKTPRYTYLGWGVYTGRGWSFWPGLSFELNLWKGGLIVVSANTERKGEAVESSSMEYLQMVEYRKSTGK